MSNLELNLAWEYKYNNIKVDHKDLLDSLEKLNEIKTQTLKVDLMLLLKSNLLTDESISALSKISDTPLDVMKILLDELSVVKGEENGESNESPVEPLSDGDVSDV